MLSKYNDKKPKNQVLSKMVDKHVRENTARNIKQCNNSMAFIYDCQCEKGKQVAGNSCNNRFCPICMFRLSMKEALKIYIMTRYLEDEYGVVFIMGTFTAPNVRGEDLKVEISKFGKAFKKMEKRNAILKINKGYIRKLEVTYNKDEIISYDMWHGLNGKRPMGEYFEKKGLSVGDLNPNYDTYHTHYHAIFAVSKSYFDSRSYLRQEKWLELWREAMDDKTITQVDIRRIKKNAAGGDGGINEIAKYAAKDSDYLISQEVFDTFYAALKGRQIITFNKLFAEANKKFKAGELDHYKTPDTTEYVKMLLYSWGGKVYNEYDRRDLTEDEVKEYNGHLINEMEVE
ncbi:MAG: protein rep [Defluviitaleaceae bacterium]|nr:protein rep [Defluviitaleaceae bacterium]